MYVVLERVKYGGVKKVYGPFEDYEKANQFSMKMYAECREPTEPDCFPVYKIRQVPEE